MKGRRAKRRADRGAPSEIQKIKKGCSDRGANYELMRLNTKGGGARVSRIYNKYTNETTFTKASSEGVIYVLDHNSVLTLRTRTMGGVSRAHKEPAARAIRALANRRSAASG